MALARSGHKGSVLTVTPEKKASVPSEPTIRCVIRSKGSSNSTNGSRFSPVTFLMEYLCLIFSTSDGLFMTLSRIRFSSIKNSGCVLQKDSRLSLLPVSRMVPSARIILMEQTIRWLLAWVPQFIPDALLAIMPPTMAEDTEAGSGENFFP